MRNPEIQQDPKVMGGAAVFAGTRVPVQTLADYLEAGHSINSFLDDFPSVRREQAAAVVKRAGGPRLPNPS